MVETDLHLKKFQKELSAGTVSLVLLAVLGQSTEPLYGYQIAKHLEQTGDPLLVGTQSALYPELPHNKWTRALRQPWSVETSPPLALVA